jgi:hypothetical protein
MNLCKDCAHIRVPPTGFEFARCGRRAMDVQSPVTGAIEELEGSVPYCKVERMPSSSYSDCGPEGKFFKCGKCDNLDGDYCESHREEAYRKGLAEHGWMAGMPASILTGKLSDDEKQDLKDAGRGHLVRE